MTKFLISLIISLFSVQVLAQLKKADPTSQASCDRTLKSQECKAVYEEMLSFDVTPKKLVCTNLQDRIRSFEKSQDFARNCAQGGWNAFQNGGIQLNETDSASSKTIDFADAEEDDCSADLSKRRAIFNDYNISVPLILRLDLPTETQFTNMRCSALRKLFQTWRREKNSEIIRRIERKKETNLTPSERDFVTYRDGQKDPAANVVEQAKNHLDDLGVQLECYNAKTAAELICEAVAEISSNQTGSSAINFKAEKIKRIYKVAGVARKVSVSAKNDEALKVFEKNAALGAPERIAETEKMLGRVLSETEKNAITQAHEVAAGSGRGFRITDKGELDSSGYSAADLGDKNKILREAGFSQGQRDSLLRQGIVGAMGDVVKLREIAGQLKATAENAELKASVEAYQKAANAFEDLFRVVKEITDADYSLAAEVNARSEKYDKAAEYYLRSKGAANSPKRTTEVVNSLAVEKEKLKKLRTEKPEDERIPKYQADLIKMIQSLFKLPSFSVNESTKMYLLKP